MTLGLDALLADVLDAYPLGLVLLLLGLLYSQAETRLDRWAALATAVAVGAGLVLVALPRVSTQAILMVGVVGGAVCVASFLAVLYSSSTRKSRPSGRA